MTTTVSNGISWRGFTAASLPEVPGWVETLGRFGHAAKGLVYFIIGFLAFKLAIGAGGEVSGAKEAIREIGEQPYGRLLLGLTAIGLLGYTLWRMVQAAKDTEGDGHDVEGMVKRTGYVISGVSYAFLGIFAGSLALGIAGGRGGSGGPTAFLLESAVGRLVLGAVAAVVIAVGFHFMYKGYKADFMTKYNLGQMSENARTVALRVGRFGMITRGIAVVIIGWFLVRAAYNGANQADDAGISGALAAVAAQPYGKVLLAIAGLGLMAYAAHMFLLGWYRRFNVAGR